MFDPHHRPLREQGGTHRLVEGVGVGAAGVDACQFGIPMFLKQAIHGIPGVLFVQVLIATVDEQA